MLNVGIILIFFTIVRGQIASIPSLNLFPTNQQYGDDTIVVPVSLTVPPSVTIFLSTFKEEVDSSPILSEVFDLSQMTAEEFSKKIHPYVIYTHTKYKVPHALQGARSCIEPILKYHKPLNRPLIVRVYSHTIAKFASLVGNLNEENAAEEALIYANFLLEHAKRINKLEDLDWKITVLELGFIDFLTFFDLFSKEGLPLLASIWIDEWKIVS